VLRQPIESLEIPPYDPFSDPFFHFCRSSSFFFCSFFLAIQLSNLNFHHFYLAPPRFASLPSTALSFPFRRPCSRRISFCIFIVVDLQTQLLASADFWWTFPQIEAQLAMALASYLPFRWRFISATDFGWLFYF
jgi:hypothetical protein